MAGADFDALDNASKTAIEMAANYGHRDVHVDFVGACKDKFPATQMRALLARGDRFRYRDGRIS